jgi:hypothetical protein
MRKFVLLIATAMATLFGFFALLQPAPAHADYFNYPCTYPFVGISVDVKVFMEAGGQFCDGPTEINGSHYHCQSLGGQVGAGGFGFAPVPNSIINLGAFGGNGIGGNGGSCDYRCPDGILAPFPNPPGVWQRAMVIPKLNFCNGHETPQGPTSELISPNEGGLGSGPGVPPPGTPPLGPNGLPVPVPIAPAPPLPGPETPPPPEDRHLPPPPDEPGQITVPTEVPPLPPVPPVPGLPIP